MTSGAIPAGLSVVAESLAAIKYGRIRVVRDDSGLVVNYRKESASPVPQFGNNDDRVDALAAEVVVRFMDKLRKHPTGIARFVAPIKNVEWAEVQPFHQLGAIKWKAMNLDYKHATTVAPTPELMSHVIEQFRAAGCNVR
jgi:hypothetical protein